MKPSTTVLAGMVALLVSGRPVAPQDSKPAPPTAPPAAARADVESIDAIVRALYDVISAPAGKDRDWGRFRSLFVPKARLIMAAPQRDGGTRPFVLSPEEYIDRAGPGMRESGFFEREIARHLDAYADIAHVFSTYESRTAAADEKPFARGINSIQLMKDKDRWWVVSVFWCQETPARPIPTEYLPK